MQPRTLLKGNALLEIGEHLIEKYFHSVFEVFNKLTIPQLWASDVMAGVVYKKRVMHALTFMHRKTEVHLFLCMGHDEMEV